eukprot:jgi/Orpsp1_1/1187724/evm.model.d7180000059683.2
MLKRLILLLALFVGVSLCDRAVTFKVIAFGEKVQVNIFGVKKYNLKRNTAEDPLFAGKISGLPDEDFEFNYVVDGVEEKFTRKMKKILFNHLNNSNIQTIPGIEVLVKLLFSIIHTFQLFTFLEIEQKHFSTVQVLLSKLKE